MSRSKKKPRRTAKAAQAPSMMDEDHYRIRDAYHTLTRAAEHQKDKKLMTGVRQHAKEQAKAAMRIARMEKADMPV